MYTKHFCIDEAAEQIMRLLHKRNGINEIRKKENVNYKLVKTLRDVIANNGTVYAYSEISHEFGKVLYFTFQGMRRSIAKAFVDVNCHWEQYKKEVIENRSNLILFTGKELSSVRRERKLWSVGYCNFFYIDNGKLVKLNGIWEIDVLEGVES